MRCGNDIKDSMLYSLLSLEIYGKKDCWQSSERTYYNSNLMKGVFLRLVNRRWLYQGERKCIAATSESLVHCLRRIPRCMSAIGTLISSFEVMEGEVWDKMKLNESEKQKLGT